MKNIVEETIKLLLKEKHKLNELAMFRKDFINVMFYSKTPINKHLICCYFWNNTQNYNHWKKEISNLVVKLPKLKNTNKYPTEKQLRNWIINDITEEIEDSIESIVTRTESDEGVEIPMYDKDLLQNYLIGFWSWLASYLANGKTVIANDIYDEVDVLVQQYSK